LTALGLVYINECSTCISEHQTSSCIFNYWLPPQKLYPICVSRDYGASVARGYAANKRVMKFGSLRNYFKFADRLKCSELLTLSLTIAILPLTTAVDNLGLAGESMRIKMKHLFSNQLSTHIRRQPFNRYLIFTFYRPHR
jgi:hypothetical protein